MKKSYVYILVPVIGMILFIALYVQFSSTYEAKQAEKARLIRQQKDEKLQIEAKQREQAIKEALAAQEIRKQQKAAKEAKEAADAEQRQNDIEARDKAFRDQEKFSKQVERYQREAQVEKDAIAKLEDDMKKAVSEEAFLRTFVRKAEANANNLTTVLDKIAAADAARAAADAAAAAAAAKKNNS